MRVAVIAEFYPRRADPVLGVWAHRQALAARDAGAEVRVLVLHRLVPPLAALKSGPGKTTRSLRALVRQPRREQRDGLQIEYARYLSPPRSSSYHAWGAWAAPALTLALARLRREFPYELIHAHNAIPAADAVRRTRPKVPVAISLHGGDVLYTAPRSAAGEAAVRRNLAAAATVLANSHDVADLARGYGACDTRVVHLGTDLPDARATGAGSPRSRGERGAPALVTVGHLVARKRHADVIKALAVLAKRHPTLRYEIVGDGPERGALELLARQLEVDERVVFHGQLPHEQAVALARGGTLFAMPSTEEAFGVAYIEAMAGGLPAIGCRGEPGPEEIAAAGDGFVLVPPGDIERLTQRIDELLGDPQRLREASMRARETVAANFTWGLCGEQTLAAYEHALRVGRAR